MKTETKLSELFKKKGKKIIRGCRIKMFLKLLGGKFFIFFLVSILLFCAPVKKKWPHPCSYFPPKSGLKPPLKERTSGNNLILVGLGGCLCAPGGAASSSAPGPSALWGARGEPDRPRTFPLRPPPVTHSAEEAEGGTSAVLTLAPCLDMIGSHRVWASEEIGTEKKNAVKIEQSPKTHD